MKGAKNLKWVCHLRLVFFSKVYLLIDEYQRSIERTSLTTSTTTKIEYHHQKQKKFFSQILEIVTEYSAILKTEDLIYVTMEINEQILFSSQHRQHHTTAVFNTLQNSSAHYPPDSICDLIQQLFWFSFSMLFDKGDTTRAEEWVASNHAIYNLLEECFTAYYPFCLSICGHIDTMVKAKATFGASESASSMNYLNKTFSHHINILGFSLLKIRLKSINRTSIDTTKNDVINKAIQFCKETQFWPGYLKVLKKCSKNVRWQEKEVIFRFKSPKILGYLGLMDTKTDCVRVLDHLVLTKFQYKKTLSDKTG